MRHSSDCTAQGQDEGLSRSSWDQADTGYESGKEMEQIRKAPTRGCNPICIFLGELEPSLVLAQAAGAASRGQEALEKANKEPPRPDSRETSEERGSWQCF